MDVLVQGASVKVDSLPVLGSGGEGVVVKFPYNGKPTALKVYHSPDSARSRKLDALFKQAWNLDRSKIALPIVPAYSTSNRLIVGFVMPYFGKGIEPVALLANKNHRANTGVTTLQVARVFLDGHRSLMQIHPQIIVGDLSDQNVLYKNEHMYFIDADAWQFGQFPCPVGTADFVPPWLYGVDFSARPSFSEDSDWYSYAVLLFRSLLLVHPYGGTHRDYKDTTARAKAKLPVFTNGVIRPKMALPFEVVSDPLMHQFSEVFAKGRRGTFPEAVLREYAESLVECPSCKTGYPRSRKDCPVCNKKNTQFVTKPVVTAKNVRAEKLFSTRGTIAYVKSDGNLLHIIYHESSTATLVTVGPNGIVSSKRLFNIQPGIRYALAKDLLAVNYVGDSTLAVYDVSSTPKLISNLYVDVFAANKRAMFGSTADALVRVVGGDVMVTTNANGLLYDRRMYHGLPEQTWFSANGASSEFQGLGFVQVVTGYLYWYIANGYMYEPKVAPLAKGESLIDISVRFSSQGAIIKRKTQLGGIEYLHTDVIGTAGQLVNSTNVVFGKAPINVMHGLIYTNGVVLYPTDNGIVQENPTSGALKTFSQTEPFVKEGDAMYRLGSAIAVVASDSVTLVQLT